MNSVTTQEQFLTRIRQYLLTHQKQVETELASLESQDPFRMDEVIEPDELGTSSWEADVNTNLNMVKQTLHQAKEKIMLAISKLNSGKFGKCDNCGKQIEAERLEAIPLASHCLACL